MTHSRESLIEMLKTNDVAVCRALLVIYENQTDSEKSAQSTHVDNGIGFTGADAFMGASCAQQYIKRGFLSPKQIAFWRKPNVKGVPKIGKYTKQLLVAIEAKQKEKEIAA